jgi:hypothetical protein
MADPKKEEKIEKKDEETPKPDAPEELTDADMEKASGASYHGHDF